MAEKHPYDPFIPQGATRLIIGSIPPSRFCLKNSRGFVRDQRELKSDDVDFYYGSRDNYFWHLIGETFGETFTFQNTDKALTERKDFLTKIKTGMTDMVDSCSRKNGGAMDKDFFDLQLKDLKTLLNTHPSVDTLIYTSDFIKRLVNQQVGNGCYHRSTPEKKKFEIKVANRDYKVLVLYSPSPVALRGLGKNGQAIRLKQYREFLLPGFL